MLNSPVYPLKSPLQLTEARKTHFKHLPHTNYRVIPLKVYNGFEGVLGPIPPDPRSPYFLSNRAFKNILIVTA